MKRILVLALVAFAALPAAAQAHPLGNFSINHVAVVSISRDRVSVHYVLDQAEIPTFQERGLSTTAALARKRAEAARGLTLAVDGASVPLVLAPGGTLVRKAGQGGLETTRVTLELHADVRARRDAALHDRTFAGRVGWKAIVPVPGAGTAVRSSVSAKDPTDGLRAYPEGLLGTPADIRSATFRVAPGEGTVVGPDGSRVAAAGARSGAADGFGRLLEDPPEGRGFLALLLLTAFGWGALHALSPGHGKTMVAAYLVGTRGTVRDALALGITVTVTHTIGVFALGLVTLALSAYLLPEDLYPWLNLVAGLMVLVVGTAVLRSRVRSGPPRAHDHAHEHAHHHHPNRRGTLVMGASAGLVPCPSALVVLLGAIAQHQVALGLVLIGAFSAGLAATLTVVGALVVKVARLPAPRRLAAVLPTVSAIAIVGVGVVMTAHAIRIAVG